MSAAAQPVSSPAQPVPAVQRYFEISLFLLVSTGVLAIVSTGKLDTIALVAPPVAILYKGYRLWRGRGPEISVRFATELVLAYFLFFPLDLFFLSRKSGGKRSKPSALCGAPCRVHLPLSATLVRLSPGAHELRYFSVSSVSFGTRTPASVILDRGNEIRSLWHSAPSASDVCSRWKNAAQCDGRGVNWRLNRLAARAMNSVADGSTSAFVVAEAPRWEP